MTIATMTAKQLKAEYQAVYAAHYSNPTPRSADDLRTLAAAFQVAKEEASYGLRRA